MLKLGSKTANGFEHSAAIIMIMKGSKAIASHLFKLDSLMK